MLAYVFSHHAADGADVAGYEAGLRRFHELLGAAPPQGFISSSTFRIAGGYSDWYLVENSAALDPLNEAAVTGRRQPAHDAVARMAVDFTGKLFALVKGKLVLSDALSFETRFSKPAQTSYPDLYARLDEWTNQPEVSLWRRMMVLGPPPEFCLLSPTRLELPAEMSPEAFARELV